MNSIAFSRILLFIGILLLIDLLAFRNLRAGLPATGFWLHKVPLWIFWLLSILTYSIISYGIINFKDFKPNIYREVYFFFGVFILLYVPKLVMIFFQTAQDIFNGFIWIANKLNPAEIGGGGAPISRGVFLSRLGLMLAAIPFASILYGMLYGRFNYKINHQIVKLPNLPDAFKGFRIVQISDIHVGSFLDNHEAVSKGIEIINEQKPDLVLFTGDLVNNYPEETNGWAEVFSAINAPMGKLAVLGNHDYCEYGYFESQEARLAAFEGVVKAYADLGFDLLRNETRTIEKEGAILDILGVENWGLPPFPQKGDLNRAMQKSQAPVRILMSHDPSHWEAQVIGNTDIALTLSGHTHGMQFGVEIGNWKWSPVKYRYPRWAGMYTEGNQKLYVNRGFGYIGFPGRVGIMPEITVLELS
jgi:predicted MPP superfamily phosphohydrolase